MRVAGIIGTEILVIAHQAGPLAPAVGAGIVNGTGIAIVTVRLVRQEEAARLRGARVVSTGVVVVTDGWLSAHALAELTLILGRTEVAIIARGVIQHVHTTLVGAALVGSTDVVIITVQGNRALALPSQALVVQCAGIAIFTGRFVGGEEAPELLVAGIVGAGIPVVTSEGDTRLAQASSASVIERAGVLVAARDCVVDMLAATFDGADVVSARVLIVAIKG